MRIASVGMWEALRRAAGASQGPRPDPLSLLPSLSVVPAAPEGRAGGELRGQARGERGSPAGCWLGSQPPALGVGLSPTAAAPQRRAPTALRVPHGLEKSAWSWQQTVCSPLCDSGHQATEPQVIIDTFSVTRTYMCTRACYVCIYTYVHIYDKARDLTI